MDLLDRLLGHDHWATACLLDLSRGLSGAQVDQPFDVGHRTLRATFAHMIFNVEFWTALMDGRPADAERDDRSLVALTECYERSYATFATLSRRLRDERRLDDTYLDHYAARKTFGGTIIHVVLHNAEHRTEALHILERLGLPNLPEIDHGLWDYETLDN
jgi:uncharacterized damage-inducible protein DinB